MKIAYVIFFGFILYSLIAFASVPSCRDIGVADGTRCVSTLNQGGITTRQGIEAVSPDAAKTLTVGLPRVASIVAGR